jgi:transposase
MRAASTDLRERSVRVVADGQSLREAAWRFGVRVSAVKRSLVRQQETGSLQRTPLPGDPRTIKREQDALLLARLQAEPDATVVEHCAWWAEHQGQPLARGDAVAGDPPPGRDAPKPARRAAVAQRDPAQLVCVDESGTHTSLTRLSGWAPHDRRATGAVPRSHGQTVTVVAALAPDGVPVPWLIAGAMETATCAWDIREPVAPTLRPGQVVVRDTVSVHTAASMREALAARGGGSPLVRPPSSPDCTPIAQAFSTRKAMLRGLGARTREE